MNHAVPELLLAVIADGRRLNGAMALAVLLFSAVRSDQHAINIWSPEQYLPEMCDMIVQCSFFEFRACEGQDFGRLQLVKST